MAMIEKEEMEIIVGEECVGEVAPKPDAPKNPKKFTRPHVDEQARNALKEKYGYSDKYHD